MQDQQIADLQDQAAAQQAPAYAPPPSAPPAYAPPPAPASAAGDPGSDTVAQLQQLTQLHDSGALTDEEFASAKQKLLSGG